MMDIFLKITTNILFILVGASGIICAFWFYNQLPIAWFRDYDFNKDKNSDNPTQPDPRMKRTPDGIWFCMVVLFILFLFFIRYGITLLFICNAFSIFFFSYIFVADKKTRIIPDQFIIGLLFVSLLWMVSDLSYLQEAGEAWYYGVFARVLGGIVGSVVLWIIGTLGSKVLKQEAMGMGDVKLMFACGVIVGISGVFWVLGLSFLLAFIPSLANIIKAQRSKKSPSVYSIRNQTTNSKIISPTNKNQIPFAPFIVVATTLYLLFPSEFEFLYYWYSQLSF